MVDDRSLPALQKAYDLVVWLTPCVDRFPRAHKFTLGDRLQSVAIDLNLALMEAAHARNKERVLYRANRLLDQLRLLLRMARDFGLLSMRQHRHVSGFVLELGKMIGGWLKWSRQGHQGSVQTQP